MVMHLREGDFIAAMYNHKWYVGKVNEAPAHEREVLVSFMAPARGKFKLGKRDITDVVFDDMLCQLTPTTPVGSGYDILPSDRNKIREAYDIYER